MEKSDNGANADFLWASVTHLENRISTVDTKANILIGVSIAIVAVLGSLAAETLGRDTLLALEIAVAGAAVATLLAAAGVVLLCLSLLNPRKSSPEHSYGFTYPQPYILWPRSGQPWSRSAEAHSAALQAVSDADLLANLRAMQTTLIFLIEAKYRYYRRAIDWTRRLVWLAMSSAGLVIAALFS